MEVKFNIVSQNLEKLNNSQELENSIDISKFSFYSSTISIMLIYIFNVQFFKIISLENQTTNEFVKDKSSIDSIVFQELIKLNNTSQDLNENCSTVILNS